MKLSQKKSKNRELAAVVAALDTSVVPKAVKRDSGGSRLRRVTQILICQHIC